MPEPEPALPSGALLILLIGLVGQLLPAQLRQIDDLSEQRLTSLIAHHEAEVAADWDAKLGRAKPAEREKLQEQRAKAELRAKAQVERYKAELAKLQATRARHSYWYGWVGLVARCLIALGAYRLASSEIRRFQVAGLVLIAIIVYALFAQGRLTIQF